MYRIDLADRAESVPDAVRLLTTGERGPALTVPASSSEFVLAKRGK